MGLTVDIQSPDYETRMAILRKKEEMDGYNIDNEEVIKYIANNIKIQYPNWKARSTRWWLCQTWKGSYTWTCRTGVKGYYSWWKESHHAGLYYFHGCWTFWCYSGWPLVGNKRNSKIVTPRQIAMYLYAEKSSQLRWNLSENVLEIVIILPLCTASTKLKRNKRWKP